MRKLIYLIAVIFSSLIFGQEAQNSSKNANQPDAFSNVYEKVEKEAEFPGGLNAFRTELIKNFNSSAIPFAPNTIIKTKVRFIVEADGTITNITAEGDNAKFNKESIKAISKIKQKWEPAMINGSPVRQMFLFPFAMNSH